MLSLSKHPLEKFDAPPDLEMCLKDIDKLTSKLNTFKIQKHVSPHFAPLIFTPLSIAMPVDLCT